jgi:hypothetical protein
MKVTIHFEFFSRTSIFKKYLSGTGYMYLGAGCPFLAQCSAARVPGTSRYPDTTYILYSNFVWEILDKPQYMPQDVKFENVLKARPP